MEKEIWKPITLEGYEGLYEVSNIGRVRSVDRKFIRSNGRLQTVKGKILKQRYDKDGYLKVYLSNRGKYKNVLVHRLVAEAFIPNPNNLPEVNHKNSKRDCNLVSNLEWVTSKGNSEHAYEYGNGKTGLEHENSRQISLEKDGEVITIFESVAKASELLNIPKKTIRDYIKNNKLLFDVLKIEYICKDLVDQLKLNVNPFKRNLSILSSIPIVVTDLNGNVLSMYESLSHAERLNNLRPSTLFRYKKKNIPYKKKFYIKEISQYEYLIEDEKYIDNKLF